MNLPICAHCRQRPVKRPGNRYCSKSCSSSAREMRFGHLPKPRRIAAFGPKPLCRNCREVEVKTLWSKFCGRTCAGEYMRAGQSEELARRHTERLVAWNQEKAKAAALDDLREVFGDRLQTAGMISIQESVRLTLQFGRLRYRRGWQVRNQRDVRQERRERVA